MSTPLFSTKFAALSLAVGALMLGATTAQAESAPIDEKAFADGVVSYERGTSNNWNKFSGDAKDGSEQWHVYDPTSALGRNNWTSEMTQRGSLGQWNKDIGVSLGKGGSLTLEFTDNYLTGSGDDKSDLWVFEIGGNPEKSLVEISMDGIDWYNAGVADRTDRNFDSGIGIDIDGLFETHAELSLDSMFSFVRVSDGGGNGYGGFKSGADIDAVAALSFVEKPETPTEVPEPAFMAGFALLGVNLLSRRRNATENA